MAAVSRHRTENGAVKHISNFASVAFTNNPLVRVHPTTGWQQWGREAYSPLWSSEGRLVYFEQYSVSTGCLEKPCFGRSDMSIEKLDVGLAYCETGTKILSFEQYLKRHLDQVWWHMPVIPATWEAEIRSCSLRPGKKLMSPTPPLSTNTLGMVVHSHPTYTGGICRRISVRCQLGGNNCEVISEK
jgi:hypothetical protein